MSQTLNTILTPSYKDPNYAELTLTKGQWSISPKSPMYAVIAKLDKDGDARIAQKGDALIVLVESASITVFMQATCPAGESVEVNYTNTFFFKPIGKSETGGGGTSYTFQSPLINTSDTISLAVDDSFKVKNDKLSINLFLPAGTNPNTLPEGMGFFILNN